MKQMLLGIAMPFSVAGIAICQLPTGTIEVLTETVFGDAVAGANVRITESATGRILESVTNEAGRYAAGNLVPGIYSLQVEALGFQTEEINNITLEAGMVYDGRTELHPGQPQFVVTAYARAAAAQALSHTVATTVSAAEIRTFPLLGRNFLDLASLAPGVDVRSGGVLDPTKAGAAYRAVSVAGRAGAGTKIQFEGIDITDPITGGSAVNVSPDAVHEFQISQSSLDSSAPTTSSGAVQIIGMSGGNRFHGTGFFNYFDQNMSARPDYNATVTPFDRKQAGGSAGGPIRRDRLFWFANLEQIRQNVFSSSTDQLFPQLNVHQSLPISIRYAAGRLDGVFNGSTRAFVNLLNDSNLTTTGTPLSLYSNVNWSTSLIAGVESSRGRSSYSYRFGHTNFNNRTQWTEGDVKFPRTPEGDPYFIAVGSARYGPNRFAPVSAGESSWQNHLNGSWYVRRHGVRAGLSVVRLVDGEGARTLPLTVFGDYSASTVAQVIARGGDPRNPLEFPLAGFSTGSGNSYLTLADGHGFPHGGEHDTRISWYAQHSIRLRRLTLNSAVRWDYATEFYPNDPNVPRDPKFERWIAGASAWPDPPRNLFSPRFGFAWDPRGNGRTVIRGGFSKANEITLKNDILIDQLGLVPAALGPVNFLDALVTGPNGTAINVDGSHPLGTYVDLRGLPIKDAIATIGQLKRAVDSAFAAYVPRPGIDVNVFTATRGTTGGFFPGNQTRTAYSLQFNIGLQREVRPGMILNLDYVHNRGIGLPVMGVDFDRQHDAAYFDVAAARAQITRILGGRTIDQWITANPQGSIASFGLFNDAIWPGISPDFLQASFQMRGLTLYRALDVTLRGSSAGNRYVRDLNYYLTYALSRVEASSQILNPELGANPANGRNWNSPEWFGPTAYDATHSFRALVRTRVPGGIDLTTQSIFRTPFADTLYFPAIGAAASSQGVPFTTDLNGDGRTTDLLPGVTAGQFGRSVKSIEDVNREIENYDHTLAGSFTPHGNALIAAGLFTPDQLRRLSGVTPVIPLIPLTNPSPWHNAFTVNVRIERPITWEHGGAVWRFGPTLDVINVFNHAPNNHYSGLGGLFGQLNFDYRNAPPGRQISDLYAVVGRLSLTRQMQVGVRLQF
jgi:hypothetical protein